MEDGIFIEYFYEEESLRILTARASFETFYKELFDKLLIIIIDYFL